MDDLTHLAGIWDTLLECQKKLFDVDNLFCHQIGRHADHFLDEE